LTGEEISGVQIPVASHLQFFFAGRRQAGALYGMMKSSHFPRIRPWLLIADRIEELGVADQWRGMDAVELPSQFMETLLGWDVLQSMTRHVDTGQPLPRTLYDKMIAAKNSKAACNGPAAGVFAVRHACAL